MGKGSPEIPQGYPLQSLTKGLGGLSLTSFVSGFFSVALPAMVHLCSSKVSFRQVLVQSDAANEVAGVVRVTVYSFVRLQTIKRDCQQS